MSLAFYGDSLTSGENNGFESYVDFLDFPAIKNGVSGTTFGEYSIYPVDGNGLMNRLKQTLSQDMSLIFLELGINDATSICLGKASMEVVMLEIRKCVDYIRQTVPGARIIFLSVGEQSIVMEVAKSQITYLRNEYLKEFPSLTNQLSEVIWSEAYSEIVRSGSKVCDYVLPLFNKSQRYTCFLDSDGLHPSRAGYKLIASNIDSFLYRIEEDEFDGD